MGYERGKYPGAPLMVGGFTQRKKGVFEGVGFKEGFVNSSQGWDLWAQN